LEKQYNQDWAKAKSRDLVKEMIARTLLRFRKPAELRVLCFPGIDAEEVFQVYDPLGIPRENVVGVEREADIADKLEQKSLGIKIERTTVEDYISRTTDLAFDVISLDYIGPPSGEMLDVLYKIARKQERNHFVLHVANLLRRDKNTNVMYQFGYATRTIAEGPNNMRVPAPSKLEADIVDKLHGIRSKVRNGEKIVSEKKGGYSSLIKYSVAGIPEGFTDFLKAVSGSSYLRVLRRCEDKLAALGLDVGEINPGRPFDTLKNTADYAIVQNTLHQAIWDSLQKECERNDITCEETQFLIYSLLAESLISCRYFVDRDTSRYTYVSESGAPMIGDIYFLSYPERQLRATRDFAARVGFPERFHISSKHEVPELMRLLNKYIKATRKFGTYDDVRDRSRRSAERVFLGNSAKPVLTKKRAIEELRSGASINEIKAKYRAWDGKPLAQWKAHVTMGTYDAKTSDNGDDEDLEKITREEAVELISANIPLKEILDAYPTSFTLGQLRAFKAHITMGTYKNSP
jgi:hypothetical protein